MKVVFRVDASHQIGTGHVSRCLALASELRRRGVDVSVVSRAHRGHALAQIRSMGISLKVLPRAHNENEDRLSEDYAQWLGVPQPRDAEETIEALRGTRPNWLIVDHYGLDAEWEAFLQPYVDKLMVIDDLANRSHVCDVLLDQNYAPGWEDRYDPLIPSDCRLFLGPRYAQLRSEYREFRERPREVPQEPRQLFVYFGGSDRHGLTVDVIRVLARQKYSHLFVTVLPGANSAHRDVIHGLVEDRERATVARPRPHLAELLWEADLAIGAGGMTSWERICLGVPSIVVSVAENQRRTCEALGHDGLILYAGHANTVNENDIEQAIDQLLSQWDTETVNALTARMQGLVDGLGAHRIAGELELSSGARTRGENDAGLSILFLGPEESPLAAWLREQETEVTTVSSPISTDWLDEKDFDFLVSFGYRHVLSREVLIRFPSRAVNLHISYLPWNRGSDPNLWSFIEDTPKGVTVHYMDEGLDTGDIIAQKLLDFNSEGETLATTYGKLQLAVHSLFKSLWADIRGGTCPRRPQVGEGSHHKSSDRVAVSAALTRGWDTPVSQLANLRVGKASDPN